MFVICDMKASDFHTFGESEIVFVLIAQLYDLSVVH